MSAPNCDANVDPGYLSADPGPDRLLDNLQALVPGLTLDMANLVCWNAVEDFYMKSTYRREHVYWQLDAGETVLRFDPYNSEWRVNRFLAFKGLATPKFVPPGTVYDVAFPAATNERKGEALLALKPASINTKLPYDVWTTYWETLLNGALFRLYMQPGKPYSDLQAAQGHAKLWKSGISSARADAQAGHLRDAQAWSYPYFASGGHPDGRW
jgi:hypothetical protein